MQGKNTDKFIWAYNKTPLHRPREVSIKSVAWKSFYYEQETENGEKETDALEKAFAENIDNVVPPIINSIDAIPGKIVNLNEQHIGTLAYFIGITLTRVPNFREGTKEFFSKIAQMTLNHLADKDQQVADLIEKYDIKAEAKEWVSLEPMLLCAQQIAHSALQKNWQFFKAPDDISLITSDNPVHFSISKEYGISDYGPAHPMAELIINLRRDLALVVTPKNSESKNIVFRMTKQEAKKFNRGVAKAARRFVFADHYSDGLEKLTKKYSDQKLAIVV